MPRRNIQHLRPEALRLYVEEGITNDAERAELLGIHEDTARKWRVEGGYEKLRDESMISMPEIARQVKIELVQAIKDLEESRELAKAKKNGDQVTKVQEEYRKRMRELLKMMKDADGLFDSKGTLLYWSRQLIKFCQRTNRIDALKLLKELLVEFYRSEEFNQ